MKGRQTFTAISRKLVYVFLYVILVISFKIEQVYVNKSLKELTEYMNTYSFDITKIKTVKLNHVL